MFRLFIVLALLFAVTGTASAVPLAEESVGPDGLNPADPYYVKVEAWEPEVLHPSTSSTDDCADGSRPASAEEAATRLVAPAVSAALTAVGDENPPEVLHGAPGCVAGPVVCVEVCLPYASYNVTEGRYYLEPSAGDPGDTGTTGIKIFFDCIGCPWPWP